ncbi:MAG: hypothetical protein QM651_07520 [Rhodoblastus sp.]
MTAIRLVLPRSDLRRWHLALVARLENAGARVGVATAPAPATPLALRLCEELESLLYGARDAGQCDRIDEAPAGAALCGDSAITFDLTGAETPPDGALTLLYDGAPGAVARDAALLEGRMPRLAVARATGAVFEILAEGLPANERPWSLRAGCAALAASVPALANMALRHSSDGAMRPAQRIVARRGPAAFLAATLAGRAKARLARLVAHGEHWRVGFRPLGADGGAMARAAAGLENSDEGGWRWLADDRRRYYADPFPFVHEGRVYLFCEEYPYATGKGVVSVTALDESGRFAPPRIVLEADCHLSYPLVFRAAGEIWMTPESSAGRRLDLYRAERFPDRWVRDRTLIAGLAISDATPFQAKGAWWMSATVADAGGSSWDCLSLFAAPDPLGPWTRCGDGPMLIDASCARPAGQVQTIGGALWRPAQDCVGGYGRGLALCRIDHVGADSLRQTVVRRLGPSYAGAGASFEGVHTLNIGGGFEFIDAMGPRSRYAPASPEDAT